MDAVLPVELTSFDETVEITGDISEMTVEQYMSWVKVQAKRLPSVYRASAAVIATALSVPQSSYLPQIEEIKSCLDDFLPSEQWERESIFQFSELRMKIANLQIQDDLKERKVNVPPLKNNNAWIKFTLGDVQDRPISHKNDTNGEDLQTKRRKLALAGSLGIDLNSSTNLPSSLLQEQVEEGEEIEDTNKEGNEANDESSVLSMELEEEEEVDDVDEWQGPSGVLPTIQLLLQFDQVLTQRLLKHLIEWLERNPMIHLQCFQWIYSLLAYTEKPIHREMVAYIRQLYRLCCKLRAELNPNSSSLATELATVNLMITVTGYYFGQSENCSKFLLPDEDSVIKSKSSGNLLVTSGVDDDDSVDSEGDDRELDEISLSGEDEEEDEG